MDGTMDTIVIELNSEDKGAVQGIDNLIKTVKKLKKVSEAFTGIDENGVSRIQALATSVESLTRSASGEGFNTAISNLRRLTRLDFSNLTGASAATQNLTDMISVASNMPSNVTAPTVNTTDTPGTPDVTGGISEETVSVLGRIRNLFGEANGVATIFKVTLGGIVKLLSASVWYTLKGTFGAMKLAVKGITSGLSKLKSVLSNVNSKLTGFSSGLLRVAKYRFFRFILDQITKGLQEGVQNLYRYSDALGGVFAENMDKAYSSLCYFKNSIGAAVSPLINALTPAIEAIVDRLVDFINKVNQLFAALSGASTWTRALKQQRKYGETLNDNATAAKKLKGTLMGFDELNRLNDNTSDSSSKDQLDYGSMFEEAPIDGGIFDFAKMLKDAFLAGDWAGVGSILADKVNSIFASIQWHEIGQKVGYWVDGIIQTLYSFADKVDFVSIGGDLAKSLNGIMESIDFVALGGLWTKKVTVLLDMLLGAIQEFNWAEFGASVGEFFRGKFNEWSSWLTSVDWGTFASTLWDNLKAAIINSDPYAVGMSIGTMIQNAANAVVEFVSGIDWVDVVNTIFDALSKFIDGADLTNILKSVASAVTAVIVQIPGMVSAAIGGILDLVGDICGDLGWSAGEGFFKSIGEFFKDSAKWLKENMVDPVITAVKDLLGIHSPSTVFAEIGENVVAGMLQGLKDSWDAIKDFFKKSIDDLKNKVKEAANKIKSAFDFEFKLPRLKLPHLSVSYEPASSSFMKFFGVDSIPKLSVEWYANGGFPDSGDLFFANENGRPEMVGSIGGKTAVANNDQIVEAVSRGVFEAVSAAIGGGSGSGNSVINLILDGKVVYQTMVDRNNKEIRRTGVNPMMG